MKHKGIAAITSVLMSSQVTGQVRRQPLHEPPLRSAAPAASGAGSSGVPMAAMAPGGSNRSDGPEDGRHIKDDGGNEVRSAFQWKNWIIGVFPPDFCLRCQVCIIEECICEGTRGGFRVASWRMWGMCLVRISEMVSKDWGSLAEMTRVSRMGSKMRSCLVCWL